MLRHLAVVSLFGSLLAQEPVEPQRFVPAAAQAVLRIQAPARWVGEFGSTRVVKLLEQPMLAGRVKSLREAFDRSVEADPYSVAMTAEVIRGFLTDYRGELLVAFQFDEQAFAERGALESATMITLVPGGDYDLADLLAGFRRADEQSGAPLTPLKIGDLTFHTSGDPAAMTQLELIDGHLVMFVGNAIERLAPGMLATTNRAERLPPAAPLSLHLELGWFVAKVIAAMEEQVADRVDLPITAEQMAEVFGVGALKAIDLELSGSGAAVVAKAELQTGPNNGLLECLMFQQGRPSLARLVPANVASFQVGAFDPMAMWRFVERLAAAMDGPGAIGTEALESEFAERTKVRLREDLLDHLGTELLTLGGWPDLLQAVARQLEDGGSPDPNTVLAGTCYGIALRDGKAFAKSIDTLLRSQGLHAARRIEAYGDREIHLLRVAGVLTVEYAITEDLLLVVLGNKGSGSGYLRSVLDVMTQGDGGLPDRVATRLDGQPDGWSGVGSTPIVDLLQASIDVAEVQHRTGKSRTWSEEGAAILRDIARDLKSVGLQDLVSVTYSSPTSLRTVFVW